MDKQLIQKSAAEDPESDLRMHALPDTLAYKIVDFYAPSRLSKVTALLTLQLPGDRASIYNVEGPSGICQWNYLSDTKKYCTNVAQVIGVRFLGEEGAVKQALLHYQNSRGWLASIHDPKFRYVLGKEVQVANAGKSCGNNNCGAGIYFFTNGNSALHYWSQVKSANLRDTPVISRKLTHRRGVAVSIADADPTQYEQRQRDIEQWLVRHFAEDGRICTVSETRLSNNHALLFSDLPRNILQHIGGFLHSGDVLMLRECCKSLSVKLPIDLCPQPTAEEQRRFYMFFDNLPPADKSLNVNWLK